MFQAVATTLSVSSVYRGVLFSLRHYCKNIPLKLRVSEALSGAELGANVKVQVISLRFFIEVLYSAVVPTASFSFKLLFIFNV